MRNTTPVFTVGLVTGGNGAETAPDRQAVSDISRVLAHYQLGIRVFDLNIADPADLPGTDMLLVINSHCADRKRRERFFAAAERLGIPRIGQSDDAYRLARDKRATSARLIDAGIPAPPNVFVAADAAPQDIDIEIRRFLAYHGPTVVVKDNLGSSSANVVVATGTTETLKHVAEIRAACGDTIVEAYVPGTEVTVPCVSLCGTTVVLTPVEIAYDGPIYDFVTKNRTLRNALHIPPRISDAAGRTVRDMARRSHEALGCKHLSRIDLRVRGTSATVLEVNGEPVLAKNDFLGRGAKHLGFTYARFVIGLLLNAPAFRAYAERVGGALGRYVAGADAFVAALTQERMATPHGNRFPPLRRTPAVQVPLPLPGRRGVVAR